MTLLASLNELFQNCIWTEYAPAPHITRFIFLPQSDAIKDLEIGTEEQCELRLFFEKELRDLSEGMARKAILEKISELREIAAIQQKIGGLI